MYGIDRGASRYRLAILTAFIALYLRYLLLPLMGTENPYHTLWLAVVVSAWFLGLGPSIVTTVLGAVGVWFWLLPAFHFPAAHGRSEMFGVMSFLLLSAVIIAMGESNRRTSATRSMLAAVVISSDEAIISKNLKGIITSWNDGAERLFGWTAAEAVGKPVTILIPPELLHEETEILKRLGNGERIEHFETVRVSKTGKKFDVSLTVSPVKDRTGRIIGASKIARDISERREAEAKLKAVHDELEQRIEQRTAELVVKNKELVNQSAVVHELSARLMQLQDEERRRIARELHDSVGQLLALVSMNIADLAKEKRKLSADGEKSLEQSASLIGQVSRDIRTISHLLHPPLLDEIGLGPALRWYIDGFSERSKINVDLEMPDDFDRLTSDLEVSIFRIVQECLTNIHRHSGSACASIRLVKEGGQVQLEVADKGKGIPAEKQQELNSPGALGVGFRGMRERVRQIGGTMEIHSNGGGTVVSATLPEKAANIQERVGQ